MAMPDQEDAAEAPAPAATTTDAGVAEPGPPLVHPPINLLVLGVASVALSAALLLISSTPAHVVGYLLASVVTISLVGFFHRTDLQRRQSPLYVSNHSLGRWAGVVAALGVAVAAVHTWSIATALAK